MLRVALALVALSPLGRCDDDHYHNGKRNSVQNERQVSIWLALRQNVAYLGESPIPLLPNIDVVDLAGRDYHDGPESNDYVEHHYGDGASPSHGDEVCMTYHNAIIFHPFHRYLCHQRLPPA